MSLTFNPALGVKNTVPVPRDGKVKLRFTATFASRYAYESARENGTRVEMWTNLASPLGDWHALPFEFVEDKAKPEQATDGTVLSLIPSAPETQDQDETSVYLNLELSDVRAGTRFAFTYRLVRPWGEIKWLGSFGKNGELVFKDDSGFALQDGWKIKEGELVTNTEGEVEEGIIAKLSDEFEWSSWAFEKDGWPIFSSTAVTPLSSAILLIPSVRKGSRTLIVPKPLAVATKQGAIAVSTTGRIVGRGVSSLTVRTVQSTAALQDILPENLCLVDLGIGDGFASVVPKPTAEADSATTLSVIAVQPDKLAAVTDVRLDDSVFLLPSKSDAVLVNVSSISGNPDILLLEAGEKKEITLRFGATGGQVLYTPLYALAPPEDETPWKLALLNPYASAFVELLEEDTSLTLPTPPPSPPLRASPSPVSSAVRTSPPSSIPIPAPQLIAEATQEEVVESEKPAPSPSNAGPLTPTSPPARVEFQAGVTEVEAKADETGMEVIKQDESKVEEIKVQPKEEASVDQVSRKPASLTVIPKQPVRGFMHLVLFWIFRALFERVCSILAAGARWWGLPRLLTGISHRVGREHPWEKREEKAVEKKEDHVDEEVPPRFVEVEEPTVEGPVIEEPAVEEPIVEKPAVEEPSVEEIAEEKAEEVAPVEPEPGPVLDEEPPVVEEAPVQDDEQPATAPEPVEEDKSPLVIVVPSPKPIFETETPTTVIIHKRAPPKPRFLADVHSNFVSLLVCAPHSLAKPDSLNISIDGKRVSESYPGYRCAQLLGDFYLLGLRGPPHSAKLEVTVD